LKIISLCVNADPSFPNLNFLSNRKVFFLGEKNTRIVIYQIGVNFINILCTHFSYKILAPKMTKPNGTREKLLNLLLYEKRTHKMLMKLTLGWKYKFWWLIELGIWEVYLQWQSNWKKVWGTSFKATLNMNQLEQKYSFWFCVYLFYLFFKLYIDDIIIFFLMYQKMINQIF